ncbi:MAG: DNA-directed RNA polymerase subunit K [Nanoarchaeota archaeon]|nr:DNA-directed RNA polymerase subunit K [Nanoarchaeota archaeon]
MIEQKAHNKLKEKFTKYETARILGARALQVSMNAPLLIKIEKEDLERIKFDPLKIAEIEFNSEALPITIRRPFPEKKDKELKKPVEKKPSDEKIAEEETKEEEEIVKGGEIMELATPKDEVEEEAEPEEESGEIE